MEAIKQAFLVFTALDEEGDVTSLDMEGKTITYSEFKEFTGGLRLTFPSNNIARKTKGFQVWMYRRKDNHVFLYRTKISGGSKLRQPTGESLYRPLPVFEVFDIDSSAIDGGRTEDEFLKVIRGLTFPHYPENSTLPDMPFVKQPDDWFKPIHIGYKSETHQKPKTLQKLDNVQNWKKAYENAIDKLLYYIWKAPKKKSGISMCFSSSEFEEFDVCTYYSNRINGSVIKYQFKPEL